MFYLRFCSFIYHFYVRKNENMPELFTFGLSALMAYFNVLTIYDAIKYFWYPELPFSDMLNYCLFGGVAILNYLCIFLPGKYKSVSAKPITGLFSIIYIVVSVAILIWIVMLNRNQNIKIVKIEYENVKHVLS